MAVFVSVGLLSLVWTPHDPEAIDVAKRLLPPGSGDHLLGTDRLGRDVLSQIVAGARQSLLVSVVSTIAAVVPGVLLGLMIAGSGPFWQDLLSRVTDVGVAFPGILVALILVTVMRPGNTATIVAIMVWFIPGVARFVIGPARQILAREYVEAAFAYGRSRWFILLRHVLPNIGPVLIVQVSIMFAAAILVEAALSYLGLGVPRPTPSWGRMLQEGQALVEVMPSLVVFPGVAIMTIVLGFNLVGDGLRAAFDPHRKTVP